MAAAPSVATGSNSAAEPIRLTLLDLVEAVSDVTASDVEIVATVLHMLESGRVRLDGNFRGAPLSVFS
ncbi:MAG: hypothetical protein ACE5FL_07705 [Myxococcota bacterium]